MAEQSTSVFRKESLQRISSPEQLTDYLKVTNPGIWMMLIAIIMFLIGLFAWSTIGKLETKAACKAVVSNGTAEIYVTDNSKGNVTAGMSVRIGDGEYTIANTAMDTYGRTIAYAPVSIADGSYDATVVIESIAPIRFLLD